jgi:hypothetical protein
VRLGAECVI